MKPVSVKSKIKTEIQRQLNDLVCNRIPDKVEYRVHGQIQTPVCNRVYVSILLRAYQQLKSHFRRKGIK